MEQKDVISHIKEVAMQTLPPRSTLLLYGSRARGDAHPESDWDLLILLDKQSLEAADYGVAYPFRELGWKIGEALNPSLYTKKQWDSWSYLPYYKNVERDKIVII
jgi:predicted nucleotidyltransferase